MPSLAWNVKPTVKISPGENGEPRVIVYANFKLGDRESQGVYAAFEGKPGETLDATGPKMNELWASFAEKLAEAIAVEEVHA